MRKSKRTSVAAIVGGIQRGISRYFHSEADGKKPTTRARATVSASVGAESAVTSPPPQPAAPAAPAPNKAAGDDYMAEGMNSFLVSLLYGSALHR